MDAVIWLGAGAVALLVLGVLAARRARPRAAREEPPVAAAAATRLERRMEALEAVLAAEARGGPEAERLQALAGRILELVRDKDARLGRALAGIDQLRARLRLLETLGEGAEARERVEALEARVAALEAQAAGKGEAILPPRVVSLHRGKAGEPGAVTRA